MTLFLTNLSKTTGHSAGDNTKRLIDSYSADMIHGVSRGEVLTPKHFLLGLGIYNLTGHKKPVQVLNRFGQGISYDRVMYIETTQAQKSQVISECPSVLPLKPSNSIEIVQGLFLLFYHKNLHF